MHQPIGDEDKSKLVRLWEAILRGEIERVAAEAQSVASGPTHYDQHQRLTANDKRLLRACRIKNDF